ncbi:hypothetical protein DENSPDRAFT_837884 [Dentipellis sp. KUC8613]|nr:hypothetical protein DENSPDRAFT_837884 [Dentipellis sp. KUC8613]
MPFTQNPANPTDGYQHSYAEGNEAEPYLAPNVPAHYRNYRPLHHGHPIVPSQQPTTGSQFIPTPSQLVGAFPSSPSQAHPSYASRGSGGTQGASSSAVHAAASSSTSGSPIICDICVPAVTFTRPHDRKRHIESHHSPNESQHICIHCNKAYARADSLKRHYDKPCDKDPRGGAGKA